MSFKLETKSFQLKILTNRSSAALDLVLTYSDQQYIKGGRVMSSPQSHLPRE
jgi:hypothetical protein